MFAPADTWVATESLFRRDADGDFWLVGTRNGVIHTARGPLINETDLAEALNAGRVAGAAIDVLSCEPPPPDNPLLSAKNCIVTPHIAWSTKEARQRLMGIAVDNLLSYKKGEPQNIVN